MHLKIGFPSVLYKEIFNKRSIVLDHELYIVIVDHDRLIEHRMSSARMEWFGRTRVRRQSWHYIDC
jgi:hypothetical protein